MRAHDEIDILGAHAGSRQAIKPRRLQMAEFGVEAFLAVAETAIHQNDMVRCPDQKTLDRGDQKTGARVVMPWHQPVPVRLQYFGRPIGQKRGRFESGAIALNDRGDADVADLFYGHVSLLV
tara:strand:- start:427 stop:792 length:366 start_codon:yes stop_codon:yes gene_type:complete